MIHIEQGQLIPDNENLMVLSETGDYGDNDLVEFYNAEDRSVVLGTFQAQFIRYGSMIYKFNEPKELGEEILKIDPNSTHTAASYVRMTNELLSQMEDGSLELDSLTQALLSEELNMEEKMTEPIVEKEVEKNSEEEVVVEKKEDTSEAEEIPDALDETIDEDLDPDVPVLDDQEVIPSTPIEEVPVITPEISLVEEIVDSPVDQPVSKLKSKKKIV